MYCRFALLVLLFIFVADIADAIPRRRRSRTYYSSGWLQVPAKRDNESKAYRELNAYCSYDRANVPELAYKNRIMVHLESLDKALLDCQHQLVAEIKLTDISDSSTVHTRYLPLSFSAVEDAAYQLATLELNNDIEEEPIIKPAKIYRLFINVHRAAPEYNSKSAIGSLPGAYYAATSGESVLDRARHRIVMKTFREWYYTERGWNRNAVYPMDCHAYYRWATGSCTVGASNGWANLGQLFGGGYHNGSQIPQLMQEGPIHGDYVRKPGHTFMLLAYDAQQGHVWTMEANFNHTIEIVKRSVGSGWTVGHLTDNDIRQELFQVSVEDARHDNMMAATGNTPVETIVQ